MATHKSFGLDHLTDTTHQHFALDVCVKNFVIGLCPSSFKAVALTISPSIQ